jgi:hypothetical protein
VRRTLQRPKTIERERLVDDNREKVFGAKRSDPVSTVDDLCDTDGKQGAQNSPESGGTSMEATGGRRSLRDIRRRREVFLLSSLT